MRASASRSISSLQDDGENSRASRFSILVQVSVDGTPVAIRTLPSATSCSASG